ncbi:MAG: hypothetical protein OHK0057_26110 [Thermoflexibacter sp.]
MAHYEWSDEGSKCGKVKKFTKPVRVSKPDRFYKFRFEVRRANLIAQKKATPMIIVMPYANVHPNPMVDQLR